MQNMPDAIKRYDPTSYTTWLEFDGKPSEAVRSALKANGWRWSGYRVQWYNNRRAAVIPEGITVEDAGTCDYASERADRLEERATAHQGKATAANNRAHAIADGIPFGQPILVGHHSEKRHRRDLARIQAASTTAYQEQDKADSLSERAEASRKWQAHKQTVGAMSRRLDTLGAEERRIERLLVEYAATVEEYQGERYDRYRAGLNDRLTGLRMAMDDLRAAIAEAGGLVADKVEVHVGDIVRLGLFQVKVSRVNPKSYSGMIVAGGAAGMTGKWDRSRLAGVIKCPHVAPEATPESAETREGAE